MGQQHRKNPPPAVREAQGNGIYLLAHGDRTIRVRSPGAGGPCAFSTGEASRLWSAVCSRTSTPPSPWGEDDAWWRQRAQQSPSRGTVAFRAASADSATRGDQRAPQTGDPPDQAPRNDPTPQRST